MPNISMAKSFIQKAEIRLAKIIREGVIESESSIIFEDIYESLREASQALMEIKGYKPYSHEALISFLLEHKLLDEGIIRILDNFRALRNDSVYQAQKISLNKCLEALDFAKKTLPIIKKRFDNLAGNH